MGTGLAAPSDMNCLRRTSELAALFAVGSVIVVAGCASPRGEAASDIANDVPEVIRHEAESVFTSLDPQQCNDAEDNDYDSICPGIGDFALRVSMPADPVNWSMATIEGPTGKAFPLAVGGVAPRTSDWGLREIDWKVEWRTALGETAEPYALALRYHFKAGEARYDEIVYAVVKLTPQGDACLDAIVHAEVENAGARVHDLMDRGRGTPCGDDPQIVDRPGSSTLTED